MKQIRKPFNIVMALILLIVVTIATIAFSSWLITDEITEKPIYQPGTVAKYYLDNQKDTYDGTSQAPTSPLFAEDELSYQYRKSGDTDYISGKPTNAGIYDIRVTIKENNEKVDVGYQIKPKPFSNDFTVKVKGDKFVHTGTAITPKITLMDGTTTLIEGTDYTLDYENNIALGNAKIIITGIGNYEGTLNQEFAIVGTSKLEIVCTSMQQLTYNGKSQLPEYTVKCGSDVITDATIEVKYKTLAGETYETGSPTHKGTYWIQFVAKKDGYEDSDAKEVQVIINQKEITVTWENLNFVYNKTEQCPTAKSTDLEADGTTLIVTGKQTNAGNYTANAIVYGEYAANYTIKSGESSSFTIKPLGLSLNKYLIEMNYDSSKRTWALIQTYISGQLSLGGLLSGDTVSLSISGMNDGTFGYGSDTSITGINNNDKTGITSYTNVVGSTYLVTAALSGSSAANYTLEITNPIIFKYKTAKVNGAYYTVEDAITSTTGDITFEGDASNATSFVYSAFSNLASSINPYSNNKNEYLISSRKFIVPCSTSVSEKKYSRTETEGNVYSSVYIPEAIALNFVSSSELLADGVIGFKHPITTITCTRGVLYNNGHISIANGCSLNAYGYVKGFGTIDLAKGSSAIDCMHTYDWPGGVAGSEMYNDVLPTNAWSVHNISCKMAIYAGAIYKAFVYTYLSKFGITKDAAPISNLIGSATTQNCLFKITSGYAEKIATPAASTPNDKALYLVTGSNQEKGQRDLIKIYGNCEDNVLDITLKVIITVSLQTGTDKPATVGYMNISVEEGSKFTLTKSDYLFLPGSSLTVKKGATVTIGSNVDVTMATWSEINGLSGGFKNHCKDKVDAKAIVNGAVIVNGSIGGIWESTEESAILNISGGNTTAAYVTMLGSSSPYYHRGTLAATGNINGTINSNFSKTVYVSVNNNGTYYWTEATNVTEFTLNFHDGNTLLESKTILVVGDTTYIVTGSEYASTKKYYDFVEWTLDKEGTIKLNSENGKLTKGINDTINLYAQWEAKKYSISYAAGYGETEDGETRYILLDDLTNNENLITEFTINDFVNNEIQLYKDVKYYVNDVEKYFEGWYVGIDKSTGVIIDKMTIKYLDAFIEQYGESQPIPLFCNFTDQKPIEITYNTSVGSLTKDKDILSSTGTITLPDISQATYNEYQYNRDYDKYFVGWQINGTGTVYSVGASIDINEDTTFIAVWSDKYTLRFNLNGGKFTNTASDIVYYYCPTETIDTNTFENPTKEHFTFTTWSATNATITNTNLTFTASSANGVILTANYSEITYTITIKNSTGYTMVELRVDFVNNKELYGTSKKYTNISNGDSKSFTYREGTRVKIYCKVKTGWVTSQDGYLKLDGTNEEIELKENINYTVDEDTGCITKGSKITLYDGTQKNIEDINSDDILLVFNHITGKFEGAPASYVIHKNSEEQLYRVIKLKFSNAKEVHIVEEHGFYDIDLKKYVYITEDNVDDFIGHSFATTDDIKNMTTTTLVGYEIVEEVTSIYSPITYSYLNCFVDGILTITNFSDGLINMFEFGDDMCYDAEKMQADIEKYGLYTYEDFAEYATLEQFNAFNGKYLKVSVEKGLITYDELINLLKTFLSEENKL